MTTRYMVTVDGDNVADGIQDERQARQIARARASEGQHAVVWDASEPCTEDCSQDDDCEHVVAVYAGRS